MQIDSVTRCLITANSVSRNESNLKIWKKPGNGLVHQPLTSQNLFLQAFDWYYGPFHFQHCYRLCDGVYKTRMELAFSSPAGLIDCHQEMSVRPALNLVDPWMRINDEDHRLPCCHLGGLGKHLSFQRFPEDGSSSREEPFAIRHNGSRPDLLCVHLIFKLRIFYKYRKPWLWSMPADLNSRSAMAQGSLEKI